MQDVDVPAWWQGLGLPGLFDVHAHFLPQNIQNKVWAQFDQGGPKIGRQWGIRYRGSHDERVDQLRAMGVRHFSSLPYAHKPGIASYLNEWSREFAASVPECLWSATFYPEEGVADYVGALVADGVQLFKLHTQVGEFELADPLMAAAFGLLEDAGTPIVIHVGSGPVPGAFTGPEFLAALLERHPRLRVIVAHMGAPEYRRFLKLAENYENTMLDTTMVFTDFFNADGAYPLDALPRLADLGHKILLGSDFPTIPYPYAHQLESIERLGFGDEWLRSVCWENGRRLFFDD
jgi:predicted TIM-barrel fold metal-dependent hydrolase